MRAAAEEFAGGLSGKAFEVFDEMCLIVVAGRECRVGQAFVGGMGLDGVSEADNGAEMFWRGADGMTESFLKGVLADIEFAG
jgi:hypothetical protein